MDGLDAAIQQTINEGGVGRLQGEPAPVTSAPEPAPQPQETQAAEVTKTGTPLDDLPDLNAPESTDEANPSTGEEQQQQQQEPEAAPVSPQKAKWEELRQKAKELDQLKPEIETLKQQLEELKSKPALPEETQRELEELRQLQAAVALEKTPEWKQAVEAPSQAVLQQFREIAEYYQVDFNELVAAADDTNPLRRGKAIREFLAKNEVEDVTPEVISIATNAAEKLHNIYGKMAELRSNASEAYKSLEASRSMETEKQRMEREQKYSTSHKEVVGLLEQRLPDIFKNQDLAKAVREAKPGDEPTVQAYQAAAAVILPQLVQELKAARAEAAKLSKQIAARAAATPNLGTSPSIEAKPQGLSLDDALGSYFGRR